MNPYADDIARVQNNLTQLNEALFFLNRTKSQMGNVATEAMILEDQVENGFHTNSRNVTLPWRTDLENAIDDAILYVNAQIAAADGNLQSLLVASAAYEQQQSAPAVKTSSSAPKTVAPPVVVQAPPSVARNGVTSTSSASKASGFAKYAKNGGQ